MISTRHRTAEATVETLAAALAAPSDARGLGMPQGWRPQSLAYGAAGIALLHIERAHTGHGSWQRAHDWLTCAARGGVASGASSHLYHGAPALAFALHAATSARHPGRYARALETLDHHISLATRRRVDRAHARMDHGALPALAEYDTIRGLTGLGAYWLRRAPDNDLIRSVLTYLVRLTEPIGDGECMLPGWWSGLDPAGRPSPRYPGGHGNNGMAHGIGGSLALLALAMRRGVTVDGQLAAIGRICAWLDRWRQDGRAGSRWPYWLTRAQLRALQPAGALAARPSWCYGTAGLARAQQLAGLATGETARQRMAENALADALTDPEQLAAITDLSLCHGYAGLAHIARLADADAITTRPAEPAGRMLDAVTARAGDSSARLLWPPSGDVGLLAGAAGVALALHAADTGAAPISGWDSCLLIT